MCLPDVSVCMTACAGVLDAQEMIFPPMDVHKNMVRHFKSGCKLNVRTGVQDAREVICVTKDMLSKTWVYIG